MNQKWANIGEDLGALPALIRDVEDHVPVPLIDVLWVFPARAIAVGESTVLVIAAFADQDDNHRVITARYTVTRNRRGEPQVKVRFDEHGTAPQPAVPRIVEGVLRRLGEDASAEPVEVRVAGSVEAWDAHIRELGGVPRNRDDAPQDEAEAAPPDGGGSPSN